ncbi:hypothetical protein O181_087429 [Austropuccinia psidii MF-1]|uniref:Reverse transcriptase Ty1/copia-type domain-containing protein n=1 Tax=Austropuccinia psidii MF-1 TaxID=1389203 RepID=A0A9Q3P1L6_9BASI|nr:hypothetical protein [Austropuccinia psidii MF-1]
MLGGWLLWDPESNKLVQSASVVFLHFQLSAVKNANRQKGSLSHIINAATLGQVPMERYFKDENTAIDTLPVAKDIAIHEHLGQALSGSLSHKWRRACKAELEQMLLRDVWEPVVKDNTIKTIGHQWVFDVKRHADGTIEKFKARLVARGYRQRPGVDCTETYALTCPGTCCMQQLVPLLF